MGRSSPRRSNLPTLALMCIENASESKTMMDGFEHSAMLPFGISARKEWNAPKRPETCRSMPLGAIGLPLEAANEEDLSPTVLAYEVLYQGLHPARVVEADHGTTREQGPYQHSGPGSKLSRQRQGKLFVVTKPVSVGTQTMRPSSLAGEARP
jgi:hypothetical protein